MKISKNRWESTRNNHKRIDSGKRYIWLETESVWQEVEFSSVEIAPIQGSLTVHFPWEGNCLKKPWEYNITAVIPCLNTSETIPTCIEILRRQTEKPYILIIDTGSSPSHLEQLYLLRDSDVEVHSIALNGVMHPSDFPAMAMDLSFTLCRTPYLFATHADCFLRRIDFLEYMLDLVKTKSPVVGYELSPRAHVDWKGMVSHTASIYDMKVMDEIGFGWSLRRLCNQFGIVNYKPNPMTPNWPDTEILGNYILKKNNITPYLIGPEENQARTLDENIDHFRSYTSGKMYSPEYFKKAKSWYEDALKQAEERIKMWDLSR
ncbi:MAG: glycosyltransferase family 2 protein [Neisseriaceae bacterium]|nr:MAG: glycosyltransferase family 2 protein [Neisseriaceae bacterium]